MIFVTKFRANDLNPSKGKQIEFNIGVVKNIFQFTSDQESAEIKCVSLADNTVDVKIKASFTKSPARGDYKIYQNADGSPDLKDFFLDTLHLTKDANSDDFYAIRKTAAKKYILYYIPKNLFFTAFFNILTDDQIVFGNQGNAGNGEGLAYATSLQKIYYGCPGTGKSHKVKGLTEGADGKKTVYFDESGAKVADVNVVEDKSKLSSNIFRTTFHPDYDYSSFVGSYKPVMQPVLDADGNETGKEDLVYAFVPQVFTNAYVRAWKSLADDSLTDAEKQVYLIIEEINRGNCAQIFGDLFQLLDRKNGFSEYPIIPDAELRKYLAKEKLENNMLRLPANLHILATMNTSDQSLFPMDSAFKRRWAMEYIPINLEQKKAKTFTFKVNGVDYSWVEFLAKVNPLIRKATDSEDKQMGEFFIKESVSEEDFKNKVMFYIWNDVCKDLYSASRISPLFFMRSADGDDRKDVFTFAELFGSGRYNEEANDYTLPSDLLEGFIKNYLKLKPKTATTPNAE